MEGERIDGRENGKENKAESKKTDKKISVKKAGMMGLAIAITAITFSQPVYAANWVHNNTGWWYREDNGSYPANQWKSIGGKWYWFNNSGYMVTGWKQINGLWYYFDNSGAMASNRWIGNYYVEASGAMATNKWIGNYYVNGSGLWTKTKQPAQWISSGGRWWYRHSDGSYTKNGWETIGGKDYLFDGAGWMLTGWQSVNGIWYYLDGSGAKAVSRWVGNYYVEANGAMATNKWIDIYYVNGAGLWVETKGQHNWNSGVVTVAPTCQNTGVKTYTCTTCGETKTEELAKTDHDWKTELYTWEDIKQGLACNVCYNDVTEHEDPYDCHMCWHTHTFYQFPAYYKCSTCNKLLHKHTRVYVKPRFGDNSDEIERNGYWICERCGNQSSDGVNTDAILVSSEGYEYGSNDHWETPYNFEKDKNNDWVIEDESWEPADDSLSLQSIRLDHSIYSMAVGDTYQNHVIFRPANPIEGKQISWESSDPSVVKVDENGVFTALKNGEATITATSSQRTATCFVRVTDTNVGKVNSVVLSIDGQSNPDGVIRLAKWEYTVKVQTNPEQAVYDVDYDTENDSGKVAYYTGSIAKGLVSEYGWQNGINYTDSTTTICFRNSGSVTVKAVVKDVNSNKIELSQKVIVE